MTEQEYEVLRKKVSCARDTLGLQKTIDQAIESLTLNAGGLRWHELLEVLSDSIPVRDAAPALLELLKACRDELAKKLADL